MRNVNVIFSFLFFLAFAMYFKYLVNRAGKNNKKEFGSYIQEEHESLFTRKHDIEDDLFFSPDMDKFPVALYNDIDKLDDKCRDLYDKQSEVIAKAGRKMLYLRNMTNLEIKKRYGVSRLEEISDYEKNYQSFVFAVYEWACALKKFGYISDALIALESLTQLGSNYSKSFMLLADIYFDKKEYNKLLELLDKTSLLEDVVKNKVKNYINSYLSILKK